MMRPAVLATVHPATPVTRALPAIGWRRETLTYLTRPSARRNNSRGMKALSKTSTTRRRSILAFPRIAPPGHAIDAACRAGDKTPRDRLLRDLLHPAMFSNLRRLPDGRRNLLDRAAVLTAVLQNRKTVNGDFRQCKPIFRGSWCCHFSFS